MKTCSGTAHAIAFPEVITEALRDFSSKEGATLFMTLLATFHGLLYRYTGQDDIVVGTPVSNFNLADEVSGAFVDMLVTRTDTSGDPVFRELLKQVQQVAIDEYNHQYVPFEKLAEELSPDMDLGRNPLFQVMFALQSMHYSTLDLPGLKLSTMEFEDMRTRLDLELHLRETDEGLKGKLVYNADLFDVSTIKRMAGHYQRMLEGIIANPGQRLSELPLLTEEEKHQILVEWNDTATDYPEDKSIHDLFEEQVRRGPDNVAVVFKDEKITYRELNERANQLARGLRSEGVRSDVVVGIMVHRSIEMISGLLGVLKAGGTYLPIDPEYPDSRIEYMLKDSGARILLTQESLMNRLACDGHRIALDKDCFIKEDASDLDLPGTSRDLAYVIYTSGSTGMPKGVMVEHRSVVNLSTWFDRECDLARNRNVIQNTTFSFDVAMEEIIATLIHGACLFIPEKKETLDKHKYRAFIKKNRINIAQFVPVTLREFLADADKIDSLNIVITAGEALDELLKEQILQKGYILYNNYGPTETTVDALSTRCTNEKVTIGKPISNTKCYILDKGFNPVPVGVAGELSIGGDGLARGYLNRPELTAEKFITDPFSNDPNARLYRTGDLVRYLPDGNIEFLGRIDNQVKLRGHRIELDEIESLLRHHPAVQETVIIVREDQPGVKRLVAYVVSNVGATPSTSELRRFLGEKLPDYMVPSVFVPLDKLPLTASCKVDRNALPAPDGSRPEIEEMYKAPGTAIEQSLAEIWSEVLGIERVGIYDNFFELGGDSLSATSIISRIQDSSRIELSPIALFEAPSVAELVNRITQSPPLQTGLNLPPVLPRSINQVVPLSLGQQEIWLSHQLRPEVPVYNEPETIYLKGPINPVTLEEAFIRLIHRHEILRTVFTTEGGVPVQAVLNEPVLELKVVDLQATTISDREGAALKYATEEALRPFDLVEPPLFRALLIRLDDSDYRLYLVFHHMVTDGVSINDVLVPELWVHYEAVHNGIQSPLPKLKVQFGDYAKWQWELLHAPILEEHLAYWRKQLDGLLPLDMPTVRMRTPVQTFSGAFHRLSISRELTDGLKALGRKEGCTLYMVLLAAFKTLLWRYTHQDDMAVGTIDAGRSRPELEPLLGYFLNTLVIRTDLSRNPTFREFLYQVRQVALEAYAHKDLPFIKVVEALKPPRDAARHPLFQVAFIMEPTFPAQESGWSVSQLEVETGTSKFDLTLELEERDENIIGRFEYDAGLFDTSTISRMIGHFKTLLEGIVTNPDQSLSELPFLTEAELHQSLVEWNDTNADYPVTSGIQVLFEAQVERTPDAIAIVFENEKLKYAELNEQSNRLAHYLRSIGVKQDTLVGIYMERSLEMMIGLLGILKAGGAYVALDPSYPKDRLIFMLDDSQVRVLISQQQLVEKLPAIRAQVICLDTDCADIALQGGGNPESRGNPDDRAYVIYTSGSTGIPKGVEISHRAAVNFLNSMRRMPGLLEQDVLLAVTTLSFDISLLELFLPLIVGARVEVVSRETASDGKELIEKLVETDASVMQATPSTWRLLLEAGWQGSDKLKILCGGEPLTRELAGQLTKRCASLWNMYGPTETTVWSTVCEIKSREYISIGRPIANTAIFILDRNLQPVPVGIPGELHIGGIGLAHGYLNLQELTNEKFITDPFSKEPGKRIYKTGDLARYLPDGNIEHLGRLDHQVKLRGFRIELGEIEEVLGQHPAVEETVVIARETMSGEKRLVAYLTARDKAPSPHELRNFLKEKLPDYMVPPVFEIIEKFPLTPNGKINRKALPEPGGLHPELEDTYVAPCTPSEEMVVDIWCEVLGLQKVGVYDNFFELGGHSLLAMKVMSRLADAFQLEISLRDLFEKPTVAGLALRITQNQAHDIDPEEMERILNELEETPSDPLSGTKGLEVERDERF